MHIGAADATQENWEALSRILKGFTSAAGTSENLDYNRYFPVFHNAEVILTKSVAIPTPSVFKQSAAFLLSFIAESPLRNPFPDGVLDARILSVANHQNVVVAFEYVRYVLKGAVIKHSTRGDIPLANKIKVSPHFYFDLLHYLSWISKNEPPRYFHPTTLLLEALAYKSNPGVADEEIV